MHSSIELIDIDLTQLWLFEIQKAQRRSDQVTKTLETMFLENKLRISGPITWMYKATTNSVGRLLDVSPERFTMLAFLNSPFVSSLLDQKQVNFHRNRRDGLGPIRGWR